MRVVDLGTGVPYAEGMKTMRAAMEQVDGAGPEEGPVLLLQEHTPVITKTRRGGSAFVTTPPEALAAAGIELVETDRGGDVTFHGPGQLVGYPILRLCPPGGHGDLLGYLRVLEDALVSACVRLGVLDAHRVAGMTGVWCDAPVVDDETLGCNLAQVSRQECKLIAIGVGVGRGVTRHGFALNVTTDLERYTRHIVPCGLVGRGVTSLERVLGRVPSRDEVITIVSDEVTRALTSFVPAISPTRSPTEPPTP
jgi:lipoyl(octanoyl) transferase